MVEKKSKTSKAKGVAKLITSFLKRESKPAKKAEKKVDARKETTSKKTARKAVSPIQHIEVAPKEPAKKKTSPAKAVAPKPSNGKSASQARNSFVSPKSPMAGPKYFFHDDIPDSYDDTYMRAMPRDPEWLFVYWELSESFRNSLKDKMGETAFNTAKKILRLYDVTDSDNHGSTDKSYTDIEINDYANNWYVHVPEPGRTYIVECGFLTTDGKFFLAVRSNPVNVPHFGLSPIHDEQWTTANTEELIRMSSNGFNRPLGASERRFGVGQVRAEAGESLLGMSAGSGSGMFGMPSSR